MLTSRMAWLYRNGIRFTRAIKQSLKLRLLVSNDETRSECAVTVLFRCQASRGVAMISAKKAFRVTTSLIPPRQSCNCVRDDRIAL